MAVNTASAVMSVRPAVPYPTMGIITPGTNWACRRAGQAAAQHVMKGAGRTGSSRQ